MKLDWKGLGTLLSKLQKTWSTCRKHVSESTHGIYCSVADTQPRRQATNPLFNMPDIETDWSLPLLSIVHITHRDLCLKCLKRCPAKDLIEWSHPPCIHHAKFVAAEQPWPDFSWLQNKLCGRSPQYTPPPVSWPLTFWPWKWCPSHVWRVLYLDANFSLPRPLCSLLRPDVRDRQTDVRLRRQTRIIA